jgi:hypothetical protein
MADFRIRRGLSTDLFIDGIEEHINPKVALEDGCWYLCTDTATLFLCVILGDGSKSLKRINSADINDTIAAIEQQIAANSSIKLYQQIDDEYGLPTDFEAEDFNPNIVYYVRHTDETGKSLGTCSTYIFDTTAQLYMCANSVDETIVNSMVSAAITVQLDDKFASMFDSKFNDRLPNALQEVFKTYVLFGGDAEID